MIMSCCHSSLSLTPLPIPLSQQGGGLFCGGGMNDLFRVTLRDNVATQGAELYVNSGQSATSFTALFVSFHHACAASAAAPLVYSELPSPLRFFHSNSSATNCPVFSGPPASCSDLPCGRSTSCIDVPAEDALDELSASCSCELNTYPNPGTSKPRVLVPYLPLADPSGGCLLPLRGQSLTWTSDAVFTTLTKTRRLTVSSNLTLELQVNGTGWVRPSGKSGPVSWSVDTATLPTWMLLPQPMGNLSEPAAGAAGAFDSISLELSPSGIASTQHHSHQLVVWLDVAPPQPMPIDVTVLVYAEPVAQSCTLATEGVDYQQILEQAVVGFTARDLDGLPTTTAAPFTAVYTYCGLSQEVVQSAGACTSGGGAAINDEGGGNYSARFTPGSPGLHRVELWLGSEALPTAWVWADCTDNRYATQPSAGAQATCVPCPPGTVCQTAHSAPVTLATLPLLQHYWRLTNRSTQISHCVTGTPLSRPRCVGGRDAGEYCAAGLTGPLCRVCVDPQSYLDTEGSRCIPCGASPIGVAAPVLVGVAVLLYVGWQFVGRLGLVQRWRRRGAVVAAATGLAGKLKQVAGFFQVVLDMPTVYAVSLPPWYGRLTSVFHIFSLNWLDMLRVPLACIGSFATQIGVVAALPWMVVACAVLLCTASAASQRGTGRGLPRAMVEGVGNALPLSLVVCSLALSHVSSRVFGAFSCDEFEASPGAYVGYLYADYAEACDGAAYERTKAVAYGLIVLWPVGVPAAFGVLLWCVRRAVLRQQPTALSAATAFLYREYRKDVYWWELVDVGRKLLLTGFLLLVPPSFALARLVAALLLSTGYLALVQVAQPFEDPTTAFVSVFSNLSLCCTLLAALLVKLFADLPTATQRTLFGPESLDTLIGIIAVFNFGVLIVALGLTLQVVRSLARVPTLRLQASGRRPELSLAPGHQWHLFLSHSWDNQDVVATVKRQLQLLLPSIQIFLDVDDLRSVDKLEAYIGESAAVLVLLGSPGYFQSANCRRELMATMERGAPLILLHDADERKAGSPLVELMSACPSEWRAFVFGSAEKPRPVVRWQRLRAFQLVSLTQVAEAVLLSSPHYHDEAELPLIISGQPALPPPHADDERVGVYVSRSNVGAWAEAEALRQELGAAVWLTSAAPAWAEAGQLSGGAATPSAAGAPHEQPTRFLLYLRRDTFEGVAGAELAEELRLALAARLPIVMLHENDEAAGGCSRFDPIYNSTPAELKDAGLYDAIAVAWYPGKFRPVSVRLASAQLFGGGRAHGVGRGWGLAACPRRSLVVAFCACLVAVSALAARCRPLRRRLQGSNSVPPHTPLRLRSSVSRPPSPPASAVRHLQELPESVSTVSELLQRLNRSHPDAVPVDVVLAPVLFPLGGVTLVVHGRVVLSGEGAVLDGEWRSAVLQVRALLIA